MSKTTVVNIRNSDYDVYIGRFNRHYHMGRSIWANPYRIPRDGTRDEVIGLYRQHVLNSPQLLAQLSTLRGKRLGCWCSPEPCHGDVLVELVEGMEP